MLKLEVTLNTVRFEGLAAPTLGTTVLKGTGALGTAYLVLRGVGKKNISLKTKIYQVGKAPTLVFLELNPTLL